MSKLLKQKENMDRKCLNCEADSFRFIRGYCLRCYPLIMKIEKINKGILPDFLRNLDNRYYSLEKIKKECVKQIEWRLKIIKDSNVKTMITAHELEYRINDTLMFLDGKTLGKINDQIASYLKNDNARTYVYQLFSKIQLLKPFKLNYYRIYEAGEK